MSAERGWKAGQGVTGVSVIGVAIIGLALASCASNPGSLEPSDKPVGSTLASLLAFNSPTPPPLPADQKKPAEIDCPRVEVIEGTSAIRNGGQANEQVRYQYSISGVARECSVAGNQIAIKVGVEGRVLIGPAGQPGSFSVPVRIVVRRESDKKAAASKFYRVAANVPAGDTQASFSVVSEVLLVPFTRPEADEDYTVLVGLDASGSALEKPVRKRRGR